MDHGSGGRATRGLIEEIFVTRLANPALNALEDAADLDFGPGRLALTTDGYVIDPPFFPGGDIGSLAVHGTINDLAMRGARPLALTAGFILEEGLPLEDLKAIVASMARAAEAAGVVVAAGDTKVVPRGAADKIFITTAGAGVIPEGRRISVHLARPGDAVLLSGGIGEHAVAVMAGRHGLDLKGALVSDSAALNHLVEELIAAVGQDLHCLRDPTRGGLAAAVNEIAVASSVGIMLFEEAVPLKSAVAAACEILGLEPIHLANEGKLVAVVAAAAAEEALAALRAHPLGQEAALIGRVGGGPDSGLDISLKPGRVVMETRIGGRRVVDLPLGELLPRIC